MKPTKLLLLAALALPAAAFAAPTTLISSSVLNGGFENRVTDNTYATTYNAGTGYWFNYGAGAESTAVYNTTAQSGTYGATVTFASNPSIGTGWSIAAGDVYNLSFYASSSNVSVLAANPIRWELYYYSTQNDVGFNETTATSKVSLFSGSVTNATVTTNNSWALASLGDFDTASLSGAAMTAAAGKELYLEFFRTSGDGVFPVIDNVTLTAVTAVPEPSTYGLLGAGALAAVAFVRRRRKFAGKAV